MPNQQQQQQQVHLWSSTPTLTTNYSNSFDLPTGIVSVTASVTAASPMIIALNGTTCNPCRVQTVTWGQVLTSTTWVDTDVLAGVGSLVAHEAAEPDRAWITWNQQAVREVHDAEAYLQQLREQQAANQVRTAEREAVRKAAHDRAEQLLVEHLSPVQRETYQKSGCFYLYTNGRKYRVDRGRTRNVTLVDEADRILRRYCAHPIDAVPDCDTMLAQLLMLRTDENAFLRIANAS